MSWQSRESVVSILTTIRQTHRPKLLLQTARIGLVDYARERDLRRILRLLSPPPPGPRIVLQLMEIEAEMEALRQQGIGLATPPGPTECCEPKETACVPMHGAWRAARHVEVLVALLGEVRLMAEAVPLPGPEALQS